MTILVVAAHPDDEVLGAGASMARFALEGRSVHALILGEGSTSRAPERDLADPHAVADLRASSQEAARRLGVGPPVHVGLPDNRFDRVDLLDIVKAVEAEIERCSPTLVLTHHVGDLNVDHQLAARAVLAATRPLPGQVIRTVMSFEVPSATEWAFSSGPPFAPTVFIDVSATIDRKIHALDAYVEEMRPAPHARSVEAVAAQATLRGAAAGVVAAEAFQLLRALR